MDDVNAEGDPAALIEAYYAAGVTDGFPVVPPSDTSIANMLAGADLRGDEVVGQIRGHNAFGQGHRANATIGRAVRLVMMNVMNTRPGLLDRACFGNPGKYAFCFAEHEDDHPWEPLHVARGLAPDESAVTVYACNSLYQVYNQLAATPEP